MPGEFYTYTTNQAYPTGYAVAQPTAVFTAPGTTTYYSYGAYNTYIDPTTTTTINRGYRRFDSNNNSTDESIHLIQRRKSANGTSTTTKEKSYSLSRERLEKKSDNKSKDVVVDATATTAVAAAAPVSPSAAQQQQSATESSDKIKARKEKKSSSKTNETTTGTSKSRSKRSKDKREIYAEEYYITDQQHFAQFDSYYPQAQYVGEYLDSFQQASGAFYDQSYQQQVACPGGPPLVPNQYAPIGDSLMHNSIAYVQDAIVEPIVTVGPRTDLNDNGFYVTSDGSPNIVPGAPAPAPQVVYQTVVQPQQQQHYQCEYLVQQEQQQPSYYPQQQMVQTEVYPTDASLPPGSKLVAEYILGYIEESASQNGGELVQVTSSSAKQTKDEKVVIEMWEKSRKSSSKSSKKHSQQASLAQNQETIVGAVATTSNRPSITHVVDSPKQSKKHSRTSASAAATTASGQVSHGASSDNINALKSEIIQTIQSELQNLKLNVEKSTAEGGSIQPIFVMPQQQEQVAQKPIYVPRNVYVPVIRPVFVPRERIIVRPQIVHVARPVLVDRPVPVTQKPIVIERDRPVPIRVETIETTTTDEQQQEQVFNVVTPKQATQQTTTEATNVYEEAINTVETMEQQIERVIVSEEQNDALNYEYAPIDYQKLLNDAVAHVEEQAAAAVANASASANAYNYQDMADYDEARKKHEITQLLDEVERKKLSLNQSSSAPYTLEVYDSTISDKFEKVDQASLKNLYGIEPYQYLTQSESAHYTTSDAQQVILESHQNTSGSPRSSISNINNTNQKMVQNFASPYIVDQK